MVSLSLQVIKYIASDQQRNEIKQFSGTDDQIILNSKYPDVLVSENLFHRVLSMIEQKKTKKSIFKTMITSLIPDVEVWGSNNALKIRTDYQPILNSCRGSYFYFCNLCSFFDHFNFSKNFSTQKITF